MTSIQVSRKEKGRLMEDGVASGQLCPFPQLFYFS